MKYKLLIFSLLALGCGKPKVFVFKDTDIDKYYLSDSVKIAFNKGYIGKVPLVAIDGVPFDYQKNLDTIILPFKKKQIISIHFLNKKSSRTIYGTDSNDGAIILNTSALPYYTTDTVQNEKGN